VSIPAIDDDDALLEFMMEHQHAAGYVPSSHWLPYETTTLATIQKVGLSKFLSIPNSFGNSTTHFIDRSSILKRIFYRLFRAATGKKVYALGALVEKPTAEQIAALSAEFAEALYIAEGGSNLLNITDSLAGGLCATVSGCSTPFLRYFSRAQWLLRNLSLPTRACVAEIGAGYGGFFEVLRKLRPDLRFVLTDIAPQLYIIEQRARAIFGTGCIVGFRSTLDMPSIDIDLLEPGQAAIVSPWHFDRLRNVWLGINHSSMQEMDRNQASNYIDWLAAAGMQNFYLINYRSGALSGDQAFTSDFAIEYLSRLGYSMAAWDALPPSEYNPETPSPFHDHFIFSRSIQEKKAVR
jgi:putative sugar O-methyltransferase